MALGSCSLAVFVSGSERTASQRTIPGHDGDRVGEGQRGSRLANRPGASWQYQTALGVLSPGSVSDLCEYSQTMWYHILSGLTSAPAFTTIISTSAGVGTTGEAIKRSLE